MVGLIDIVGAACDELGYDAPTVLVGSTDPDARQFLALASAAGRELVRAHDWAVLQVLWTFPTVAGQSDYTLPADYARLIDETQWDRSTRWPLVGPVSPQADRAQREGSVAPPGMRRDFRLVGPALRLFPTPPTSGDTMALEYVSRFWLNGGKAERFAADTDVPAFDFDLMVKELRWRWLAAKGMNAVEARGERDVALEGLIAADLGGATLDMGGGSSERDWTVTAVSSPDFTLGTGDGAGIAID